MSTISVKAAATLLWCYAGLLVLEAIGMGVARNWSDTRHLVQHLLVGLAYVILGWSVWRERRWAWWVVVIVVGGISLLGVGMVIFVILMPTAPRAEFVKQLEELFQFGWATFPLLIFSVVVLAGSVVSLLTPQSRQAFFRSHPR